MARAALLVLRAYKVLLSPLFRGSCRFTPSCADYTAEAIRRHGLLRGVALGTNRLARCHPWGAWGFDPVPLERPGRAAFAAARTTSSTCPGRDAVSQRRGAKVQ